MLENLVKKNRSYRRFVQKDINEKDLKEMINLARFSASSRNRQALKYIIVKNKEKLNSIFRELHWAGFLKEWKGPSESERPVAYIIALHDKNIKISERMLFCDLGLAVQNILLAAVEKGFGGCIMGAFNPEKISEILEINQDKLEPLIILSLGIPLKEVLIEDVKDGDTKYYRDEKDRNVVPKRSLEEIVEKIL